MRGSRRTLLPRWCSSCGDKKLIVESLREAIQDIKPKGRGQPPKHPIKDYVILIILKEAKNASLRDGETDWSEAVCGERIDHSVIHYWEKRIERGVMERAVRAAGSRIEEVLGYEFSVIDATRFADWRQYETGFHLLSRIQGQTVYPVSMCTDTLDPVPNTRDAMVPGSGPLMGDAWYDVNKVFRDVFRQGYVPLICPNRNRDSGWWRKTARKVYAKNRMAYRQRGRGESVFGSLTNAFGGRLDTRLSKTAYIRSAARVIAYQVRILIRANGDYHLIVLLNS